MSNTTSQPEQSQIQEQSTTIINDQRIVEEESARIFSSTPAVAAATSLISEQQYTLNQTFSKPIMLGQFDWDTTQVQHQLLATYDISQILKTNPSQPLSLQRIFKTLQYGVDVEIMSQGTIYHQGTLIAFFNPMDTCKVPVNSFAVSGFPNIVIDAAIGTPGKIHIPFAHIFPYLRTGDGIIGSPNTIGTLSLLVLNPLEIGTGASPTVPITVYATPTDPQLQMAIFDHDPSAAFTVITNHPQSQIIDRLEKGSKGVTKLLEDGKNIMSDIFCDNPEIYSYSGIIPQSNASFNHTTSSAYCEVLDPVPSYGYFPEKAVTNGDQGEEHSITLITKIPMIIATIDWSTTDTPETDLVNTFVTPMNASQIVSSNSTALIKSFQPSFLSNMGAMHAFWDGDIHYTFYFVKTKFVTGRIIIAYVPLEERVSPTYTLQQLQACPNMIIDVKDERVVYDFIVPYIGNTPRKYTTPVSVPNFPGPPEILGGKFLTFNQDSTQLLTDTYSSMYHSGKLVVKVLNRLTAPPGVSNTVHFNVLVSAGENFSYHNATIPNVSFDTGFTPITNSAQAATVPDSSMSRSTHSIKTSNALQLGSGPRISSPGYKVPEHDSILTHLKRYYTDVHTFFDTTIAEQSFVYLTSPFSSTLTSAETSNFNLRDFIVGMYVFYTGSQKYMVNTTATKDVPIIGMVSHVYDSILQQGYIGAPYIGTILNNYPTQFLNLSVSPTHHYNTPYRSPYNQLLVPDILPSTPAPSSEYPYKSTTGNVIITFIASQGSFSGFQSTVDLYLNHAVGDDFTLNYLRSPRPLLAGLIYLI